MRPLGLDPNDPLVRTAVFGVEVQEFLRSAIGSFLLSQAEKRIAELVEALKVVSPNDVDAIIALQAEIRHLEQFEGWLAEAVQAGLTATAVIDGELDGENP